MRAFHPLALASALALLTAACGPAIEAPSDVDAVPADNSAAEPADDAAVAPADDSVAYPDPAVQSPADDTIEEAYPGDPDAASKVSANDASEEELVAAFEAAGIDNAEKWADEVIEYRPYPSDDPDFAHLREELAKYNPGPGVVDQIVATLKP